jgi:hypothetical protein
MVYCRLMDDLSGRHVHVAGIRRVRDFWLDGDGSGGVDGIREGGDGVCGGCISQGRADDGEEGGNGIGRRKGGHKRVDGYMLILSIRRTIVHERVHGRRKGQAAARSLGKEPVYEWV